MHQLRLIVTSLLTFTVIVASNGVSDVACRAQEPSDSEVIERVLQRAVDHLVTNQLDDGRWTDLPQHPFGVTALCTLALLNAGLEPESPAVAKALARLEERELTSIYSIAVQTMAFCAANPDRYAAQIERNARQLVDSQLPNGGWTYGPSLNAANGDPSNAQFALLALHEAQRTGHVAFDQQEWRAVFVKAKGYWEDLQNADGGFPYSRGTESRGSMTAAGIASLVIVGAQLADSQASVTNTINCCGNPDGGRDRVKEALSWLAGVFSANWNPGPKKEHLYYLYALERAGRMTGQRFIGDHDWYREGAAVLRLLQDKVGGSVQSSGAMGNVYTETAFAILFLAKGKRQIVVSRAQHGASEDWNRHPSAIQNLTAHTEAAWKRDLAWQNVNLNRSTLADLLESPVLFLSGTRAPNITNEQKVMLKEYVEQGGFIFAEGCKGNGCNGDEFEQFIKNLAVDLFESPLTKLPPEHPIWIAEARIVPSDLPQDTWLYGVESCCRLGMVYCPSSLSCRWELNPAYGAAREYPPAVQGELDTFTKIGLNVLAYATGKELKEKLDLVTILEEEVPQTQSERNTLFLPVLRHNAGADDVPQASPKLLQWFGKELPVPLSSEKRLINITFEEMSKYPIVYIHGRGKLRLSEGQREAIKEYLENDGFVFGSAICADEEFARSFREELQIITGSSMSDLAADHRLLSTDFGGFDIGKVRLIDPDVSGEAIVTSKRLITPKLEVARVNRRISVVFSPLDISCALESRHSLQCRGYIRDDAARIGMNVILFAFFQP